MAGVSPESLLKMAGYALNDAPPGAYRLALRLYMDSGVTARDATALLRTYVRANLPLERDPRDWVVVGIDVGSGGLRIIAITGDGQLFSLWSKPWSAKPIVNLTEILSLLNEGMRHVSRDVRLNARVIAAAGLAVTVSNVAFLGRDMQPVHRIIPWPETEAVDEAAEVAELNRTLGGVVEPAGATAEGIIPRLRWECKHTTDLAQDVTYVCDLSEVIAYALTGKLVANTGARIRKWGFLVPPTELLARLGMAEFADKLSLPGIPVGGQIGDLSLAVANRWGMPDPVPLVQAGWDSLAAAHALAVQHEGTLALTLGTSWTCTVRSWSPRVNAAPSLQPQAIPGVPGWLVSTGFLHAGELVDEICDQFCQPAISAARERGLSVYEFLDSRAMHEAPQSVRCIPGGRRWLSERATTTLVFDLTNGGSLAPRDIYVAVRAGLVHQLSLLVGHLRSQLALPISLIRAGGRGAESDSLLQWIANSTECDVQRGPSDATAIGAALFAAVEVGLHSSLSEAAVCMARARETFLFS